MHIPQIFPQGGVYRGVGGGSKDGIGKSDVESMKINRILKLFISLRGENPCLPAFIIPIMGIGEM